MKRQNKADRALDKAIEASYYRQAQGRQIDIMKIGALFADARARIQAGTPVDDAVKVAIETFCMPKGGR